jgi:hypothetical protein
MGNILPFESIEGRYSITFPWSFKIVERPIFSR